MKKIVLLLVLSFIAIEVKSQEFKVFKATEFSINHPEDWTPDTSGQMNTSLLLFSKPEQNDTFRENVNVMIQDLTGMNLNLKKYTELSLEQIKSIKDSKIFESTELKRDGETYHQLVWKGFVSGKKLKFKQLYFIKNNKAFLVTLTCEEKAYDDYVKTGTLILNSFILN